MNNRIHELLPIIRSEIHSADPNKFNLTLDMPRVINAQQRAISRVLELCALLEEELKAHTIPNTATMSAPVDIEAQAEKDYAIRMDIDKFLTFTYSDKGIALLQAFCPYVHSFRKPEKGKGLAVLECPGDIPTLLTEGNIVARLTNGEFIVITHAVLLSFLIAKYRYQGE